MQTNKLLSKISVTDIFTTVYVLIDDYLKESTKESRISLPKEKSNQKASYSEIRYIYSKQNRELRT